MEHTKSSKKKVTIEVNGLLYQKLKMLCIAQQKTIRSIVEHAFMQQLENSLPKE